MTERFRLSPIAMLLNPPPVPASPVDPPERNINSNALPQKAEQ